MKKMTLPLLIWSFALAMVVGAVYELRLHRNEVGFATLLAELPKPAVQKIPLGLADYQSIQKKILVFGSVELAPAADSLVVHARYLSDYAAWRLTIDQVLLDTPDVLWNIDYLCSGKCPSGHTHKAVLVGNRVVP